MYHQYVYTIHLYSKKRIFTLIDTYMYKIVLPDFIRESAYDRLYQFV